MNLSFLTISLSLEKTTAEGLAAKQGHRGFSLIEVMIVVVIVGILAAVALPSYRSYLRRGARGDAQALMMDAGQRQGQYLLDSRAYAASLTALKVTVSSSLGSKYTFTVDVPAVTPPTFAITATPIGDQANDSCGTLTLDNTGAKGASGTGTCW